VIEVDSKINDQHITILIDSGTSHSYIDPNIVEIFHLQRSKHGKYWLVYFSIRDKRIINEMVKDCPMDMNGLDTKVDLNIIPLGSYDFLIGMDWLDKHHDILYFYNKDFTCLDEEGNLRQIQGIPKEVSIR
jgi:hypothetical protein